MKLHFTGIMMWKKCGNLGKIVKTNELWGSEVNHQASIHPNKQVWRARPTHRSLSTDTSVGRVDGGWEDTGAKAPNASQFLRRHHILVNAFINTVQRSLCYVTSWHARVSAVTLRVPKAANLRAGLFQNRQVSYGFLQPLLLVSRPENKGQNKLGKDLISSLRTSELAQGKAMVYFHFV